MPLGAALNCKNLFVFVPIEFELDSWLTGRMFNGLALSLVVCDWVTLSHKKLSQKAEVDNLMLNWFLVYIILIIQIILCLCFLKI